MTELTQEMVEELRDYMACDELVVTMYHIEQDEPELAGARLEGALGVIESVIAQFVRGGMDS